jgi:hypothetical protein
MSIFSNSKSYFQNLTILSSSLILVTSVLTFSLPKISVSAEDSPAYMIVTHPNGINIRNSNCQIVDQAGYGEPLYFGGGAPIPLLCKIGGEDVELLNYGAVFGNRNTELTDQYVAAKFVKKVNNGSSGTYTTQDKVRLNNPSGGGVNLRDNNCQRVTTLPSGTYSENSMGLGGSVKICKAGNEFYTMGYFIYKGKVNFVATTLLKFE